MLQPPVCFQGSNSRGCVKCLDTNNGTDTGCSCQREELRPCITTRWIIHNNPPSDFIHRLHGKPRTKLLYSRDNLYCKASRTSRRALPFFPPKTNKETKHTNTHTHTTFQKADSKELCLLKFYLFLVTVFVLFCFVLPCPKTSTGTRETAAEPTSVHHDVFSKCINDGNQQRKKKFICLPGNRKAQALPKYQYTIPKNLLFTFCHL